MKKLNSALNQPWRTTCRNCGSYELYVNTELNDITEVGAKTIRLADIEIQCDNCSHKSCIVYDKKQNKNTHVKSILL